MRYKSNSYCQKCKIWDKPLVCNSKTKTKFGVTHQYLCRECAAERRAKYYRNNKEKCRAIIYKSIKKHQHKHDARMKLNQAILRGEINRPDLCNKCNKPGRISGHHHDYSKPLQVEWLCGGCHSEADRQLRLSTL